MRIIAHNKFHEPIVMDVTSVMVLDDEDNPIVGAIWHQQGHIQAAHVFDKDFPMLAGLLGFDRKVVVDEYSGQAAGGLCQTHFH